MGPWTRMEEHALLLMCLAVALWATDLIHHIPPAVIGIGVGLLAGVPGLGILELEDLKRINYLPVFFTATAVSMGEVLLRTNALNSMTTVLFAWMRPWMTNVFSLALVPYWTAFVYHMFLGTEISLLATSLPPRMNFAKTAAISPL